MHEQGFKASCVGLVHGTLPEPCVVILGVAGDLARTTLVPSLYALGCQRLLPEPFALLGVARRAWDDDTFRDAIRTYAREKKGFSDETWRQLPRASAEDEGIGTRAGYYDTTGVVRDMAQNHLLQLLCMAAWNLRLPMMGYHYATKL